LKGTYDPMT